MRRYRSEAIVVVAPHLTYGLYRDGGPADFGAKVSLPTAGRWQDVFSGTEFAGRAQIRGSELFRGFSVAVLFADTLS